MKQNSSKLIKSNNFIKNRPNSQNHNENSLTSFKMDPKSMEIDHLRTPEQKFTANRFRTPKNCLKIKYTKRGDKFLHELIEDPQSESSGSDFFDFPKLDVKIEQTAPSKKKMQKIHSRIKRLEANPEWAFLEDRDLISNLERKNSITQTNKNNFDMNHFEIDLGTVQKKKNSIQIDLDCEFAKYHSTNIFSESETTPTKPILLLETRKGSEHFLAHSSKDLSLILDKKLEKKDYITPLKTHKIKKKRSPPKIRSRPRKKNKRRNLEYFLENINLDKTSCSIANLDIFAEEGPAENETSGFTNDSSWKALGPLDLSNHRANMIYSTPNNNVTTSENQSVNKLNLSNNKDSLNQNLVPSFGSRDSLSDLRLEKLRSEMQTTVSKSSLMKGVSDLCLSSKNIRQRKMSIFNKKKRQNDIQKKQVIYNPNVVVGYKTLQCFF